MIWIEDFQPERLPPSTWNHVLDHRNYIIICILYILNVGSTGLISGVVGPPINGLINGLITGVKKPLLIGVMRLFVLW